MKLGLVGAGSIGKALATFAVATGHQAMLSNSRGPNTLLGVAGTIGCKVGTVAEAAAYGDVVVIAVPFHRLGELNPSAFSGKIVIDTNNYSSARDGAIPEIDERRISTTGYFQRYFPDARVVKAFNTIFSRDIANGKQTLEDGKKRALPISGDDREAKAIVSQLLNDFGYDVVDAGGIAESWRLEMGKPSSGLVSDADDLKAALKDAERDVDIPFFSWKRRD
jgi:8-hydroxy-5-deazaflavin:NADPH oxidoreductase